MVGVELENDGRREFNIDRQLVELSKKKNHVMTVMSWRLGVFSPGILNDTVCAYAH